MSETPPKTPFQSCNFSLYTVRKTAHTTPQSHTIRQSPNQVPDQGNTRSQTPCHSNTVTHLKFTGKSVTRYQVYTQPQSDTSTSKHSCHNCHTLHSHRQTPIIHAAHNHSHVSISQPGKQSQTPSESQTTHSHTNAHTQNHSHTRPVVYAQAVANPKNWDLCAVACTQNRRHGHTSNPSDAFSAHVRSDIPDTPTLTEMQLGSKIWSPGFKPDFGFASPAGAESSSSRDAALSPREASKSRKLTERKPRSGRGASGKCSPALWTRCLWEM